VRVALVLVALAACGGDDAPVATDCKDGETRECYGGPEGTLGVGPGTAGLEVCSAGRWPGICIGEATPPVRQGHLYDDNCNGVIDDVETTGDACTGTNGCEGVKNCDEKGKVRCFAPSKNDCDLCGGPDVYDIGDDCIANGCTGALVCTSDGRASECAAPTQNECNVCGGPAVTGLDATCMSQDNNCSGTMVCNAAGTAAECNAPNINECGACFPSVGTLGSDCTDPNRGCAGMTACNGTGDGVVCTQDASCGHIVISELATDSATCNTDEYVELYNPTSRTISLKGYTLRARIASSGNFVRLVAFADTASIASHGYFLVASAGSAPTTCPGSYNGITANTVKADATYTSADLNASVGAVWLTTTDLNPTGPTDMIVVDMVGYDNNKNTGDSTMFEGTDPSAPPQPVDTTGSMERKANASSTNTSMAAGGADVTAGNGYDTDQNGTDFVFQTVRTPQNKASGSEP